MDDEIRSLIKVWSVAIALVCYCYYIASKVPKGILRLISLLPVIFTFTILPLNLFSFHLCGPTFFFLTWLRNFKLLLFAFDLDPLSHPLPNLFRFIAILSLPIKIKQNPFPTPKTHFVLALKIMLLGTVIRLHDFEPQLNGHIVFILYCLHLYLGMETVLALCALPATAVLGAPQERQFDEPYLSSSLQDFWGRRWNLMVTNILRPTVYNPTSKITSRVFGPRWARLLAMIAAFTVSGFMHEAMYYYLTRVSPTWEVTSFFVLHGICTAAEVVAKEALPTRLRLQRWISGPLTLVFLMLTARWLMFPQLLRNGVVVRAIGEHRVFVDFVKDKILSLFLLFYI